MLSVNETCSQLAGVMAKCNEIDANFSVTRAYCAALKSPERTAEQAGVLTRHAAALRCKGRHSLQMHSSLSGRWPSEDRISSGD